ncbi:MAG TPA: primosomal protein N' [Gemmatimonadales bacterium]|nr:primosomal protein N' [Gemmatimonadales bacterium]
MTEPLAHVALPLPLAQPYTYRIPDALRERVAPGARVVVPVRRREMVGIVTDVGVDPPGVEPKPILGAPDPEPALPGPLLETARWMARYYAAPLGIALRCVLPAGMWGHSEVIMTLVHGAAAGGALGAEVLAWLERQGGEGSVAACARALKRPLWDAVGRLMRAGAVALRVESPNVESGRATERVLVLAGSPPSLLERERLFKRAPLQRLLYEAVEELGGSAPARHLKDRLRFRDGVLRALVARGLARWEEVERVRDPFAGQPGTPPPATFTPDQEAALAAIAELPPGDGALLFGVTGSGKTLVYLETIRRALAEGKGAIVLVPEIGLTPQTVSRVRGAFGEQVAVLHSGLSDGERADAWRLLRRGERRVAVGARSAVFAPVADLGVIVVDEEHEASYKNGESPRYHAREVAAVRARLEGARLILGSATPSPETVARVGPRFRQLRLPARVGDRPLPRVDLVDLRVAPKVPGMAGVAWSEELDAALLGVLARREQALLLLNRRGYASYLQCPSCGEVWQCGSCSIALTVHQSPARLRCHYCNFEQPTPGACRRCGHAVQHMKGVGTQQLERVLAERFPEARIARMDLDTTSTKWSHQRILGAFERGEVDVLVGTQMIAKGLDFPNVTLVGVVDADTALHLPDFRSAERTFQLLAQVAGRAGRGPKGGRVVVQTRNPDHHALRHAATHDVDGFLAEELARRVSPPYPPVTSLANVVVSGLDEREVGLAAAELAELSQSVVTARGLPLTVLGPAPCVLARLQGRWRWHVLLKGPREPLGRLLRYLARRAARPRGVRMVLDRDAVALL